MKVLLRAVSLLFLLIPVALLAQQASTRPAQPPAAGEEVPEPPDSSSAEVAGSPPATSPGEPGNADQTEGNEDSSPFDYKASEQISEDLSVSFPVDI